MQNPPDPGTGPGHTLPSPLAREVYASLCATLPRLPHGTPDARAARDALAMDAATALHPTNALEAKLAVSIVAAQVYAEDSFRQADENRADVAVSLRCLAQANALLRDMRHMLRHYQRMQAEHDRAIAEMHPAAMERAGYWFSEVGVPAPAASPAEAPAPADTPEPAAPPPAVAPAAPAFETLTEVEQYALQAADIYARRSA